MAKFLFYDFAFPKPWESILTLWQQQPFSPKIISCSIRGWGHFFQRNVTALQLQLRNGGKGRGKKPGRNECFAFISSWNLLLTGVCPYSIGLPVVKYAPLFLDLNPYCSQHQCRLLVSLLSQEPCSPSELLPTSFSAALLCQILEQPAVNSSTHAQPHRDPACSVWDIAQ